MALSNLPRLFYTSKCVITVPGPEGSPDGGFSTMMLMVMGWIVMATALFLFRPASLRRRADKKVEMPDYHGNNQVRRPEW